MSASTEKKNRSNARQAGTDKKMLAAQEEARKKAVSKRRWTWGTIGVVVLIAAILLLNSGLMYTATTALTAGGVKYTPAQVNYYYGSDYLNFANQYGSYASAFGLDTSMGISGLGSQDCPMLEDGTWRDYFRDAAKSDVQQIRALLNYAAENGITLTEEEIAEVDAQFEGMEETAKSYGYSSADGLYSMNYGSGVTTKIVRQAALDGALAQKVYNEKQNSLTWTDDELEAYYAGLNGDSDYFTYDYYDVSALTVENPVVAEDGTESVEMIATDASRAAAQATADAIAEAYRSGDVTAAGEAENSEAADMAETDVSGTSEDAQPESDAAEEPEEVAPEAESTAETDFQTLFAAAVDAGTGGAGTQPTQRSAYRGSYLPSAYADWLKDPSRQAGDVGVFASSEEDPDSYTVVLFVAREDNHYHTASVRHILVMAEADEDGTYSMEALTAARERAEEILAEYEAGDRTEESFAALAEQYSEDSGSNTNGGLYENIARGQMVEEFDVFCFEEHQPGDTGIVFGESSSYAGYHVMYYVGEGELYSNYLARTDLQSEAMENWNSELAEACTVEEGFGFRFVGK